MAADRGDCSCYPSIRLSSQRQMNSHCGRGLKITEEKEARKKAENILTYMHARAWAGGNPRLKEYAIVDQLGAKQTGRQTDRQTRVGHVEMGHKPKLALPRRKSAQLRMIRNQFVFI